MSILLDATTSSNEPLLIAAGIVVFAVIVFLAIKGKLRDWIMR
jgi:hypothetical protein